ncbi:MAG: PocR ligand-binding domain-containing protein [Myxococcales bacterium]|nr:PocR ligand-binding domain-containing protein [Myxococcales bacterium]
MDAPSLLDQPVTLAEILDQDSLQRVCMTFARVYRTGLSVLDTRGHMLVDIPAEHALCRRVRALPQGADICSTVADELAELTRIEDTGDFEENSSPFIDPVGGDPQSVLTSHHCICGLSYEVLPIEQQGVVLGRLVYGPYRRAGTDALDARLAERTGAAAAEGLAAAEAELLKMPEQSAEDAAHAVRSIGEVLSVIVQTGYARHLTSQIHIAAIQDAYNELQEKNRRLNDSLDKLKELDKLKSNFLATVSHELRTPLTSVIGYSEMLLEGLAGKLNKEQRDYVQTIMDKGDQLLGIISEILDISKIESGAVQLLTEPVNVGELLTQVSDAMMPQARRKKIALTHRAEPGVPSIVADRSKARQILLNLLSNAIKFTPDGGHVEAIAAPTKLLSEGTAIPQAGVELRVIDSGVGVPEAVRERIFEAFYQVDNSSTRLFGGTGLGLSIVKHFVEAHGGQVWVEAGPDDEGSTFVVRLPLRPPAGRVVQRHMVG